MKNKKRNAAKRIVLSILLWLVFSTGATAAEVSQETARVVAENYIASHLAKYGDWGGSTSPAIVSEEIVTYLQVPVAYNFAVQPSGHLLIAFWDQFSPVLLYSTSSAFLPSRVNEYPSIESWILPELYAAYQSMTTTATTRTASRTIAYADTRVAKAWERLRKADFSPTAERFSTETTRVAPLLSTTWAQGTPYNQATPGISGNCNHTQTGCVATAWAQVMKYWNWPDQGVGSHSYYWSAGAQTLSADFAHAYSWSEMPDKLTSSSTTAQKDAVARLVADVGFAANMNYGCSSSGSDAWANDVLDVYFGYKSSMVKLSRGSYTDSEWFAFFKAELDADPPRPVILSIFTSSGGHEVVVDGYQVDVTDQVHINFGWGESYDGFYDITHNFTASYTWYASTQVIVTNIEPDSSSSSSYLLWTK